MTGERAPVSSDTRNDPDVFFLEHAQRASQQGVANTREQIHYPIRHRNALSGVNWPRNCNGGTKWIVPSARISR